MVPIVKTLAELLARTLTAATGALFVDEHGRLHVTNGGGAIALVNHADAAELPGSGELTEPAVWDIPAGLTSLTVVVTYTLDPEGAGTGFARARPMWGNGSTETPTPLLDASAASSLGRFKRQRVFAQEVDLPVPAGAGPESTSLIFDVPPGKTTFRLLLAEAGDTANPGTAGATIEGGF